MAASLVWVMLISGAASASIWFVDSDSDFVEDPVDNCVGVFNPFQFDSDSDGVGDLCDADATGVGTDGDNTLVGTGGPDALFGLDGDDSLDGLGGNDFLAAGLGDNTSTGGPGCDVFAFDPYAAGSLLITDYQAGIDRFAFPPMDDDPSDDPDPEPVFGGETDLNATFMMDDMPGAVVTLAGIDSATVGFEFDTSPCDPPPPLAASAPVDECAGGSTLVVPNGTAATLGTAFVGTPFSDTITIAGEVSSYYVIGDSAGDVARGCHDTITGDFANLWLYGDSATGNVGTGGNDTLNGGDGFDWLYGDTSTGNVGTGGNDTLNGGPGNDKLYGDSVSGNVTTGGNDTLNGGPDDDKLYGDVKTGNITLGGDDTLNGGDGEDELYGDANSAGGVVTLGGNDTINGGDDDDIAYGDSKRAKVVTGGNDTINGGDGSDHLYGDTWGEVGGGDPSVDTGGNDTIDGGEGDDFLYGDTGNSAVTNAGDDTLIGGLGDDELYGDSDAGTVTNAGADTFVFDTSTQFSTATGDEIKDAGAGGVTDILKFTNVPDGAGDDIADLEAVATVTDDGTDVTVTMNDDNSNVEIEGIGGFTIDTVQKLHDTLAVDIAVEHP